MRKWIMEKLGIENQCEKVAEIGYWMGESMAQGFNTGGQSNMTAEQLNMMARIGHNNLEIFTEKIDVDKSDNTESVHDVRNNHDVLNPLIEDLTETMWAQQEKVLKSGKYEHPVHPRNCNMVEWMRHQMEEMADALIYHECMQQTMSEVREEIRQARILNMQQVKSTTRDRIDRRLSMALERLGEEKGE